jgi:hypothetical protein
LLYNYSGWSAVSKFEKFTKAVKTTGVVKSSVGLAMAVVWMMIFTIIAVVLMTKGLPVIVGVFFIGTFAFVVITKVVQLSRAKSADTKPGGQTRRKGGNGEGSVAKGSPTDEGSPGEGTPAGGVLPGEILTDYIAGIMRYGSGAVSYSVLDTGKNMAPENCLLITNKGIRAVTVPVSGAGKVVSGTDISKWQWMTMQSGIEKALKDMINIMSLGEILHACGKHIFVSGDEIAGIKFSDISNGVTVTTKDKKKYSWSVRDKDDYGRAKNILSAFLP